MPDEITVKPKSESLMAPDDADWEPFWSDIREISYRARQSGDADPVNTATGRDKNAGHLLWPRNP